MSRTQIHESFADKLSACLLKKKGEEQTAMREAMRNGEDRRRMEKILDSHLRRVEHQQRVRGAVSEQIDREQVARMLSQHLKKKMSSAQEKSQSIDRVQVAAMLNKHLQNRLCRCKVPAFGEVDASRTDRKKVAEILSQHLRTKIQVARSQQADKEARDSRREDVKSLLENMLQNHLAPKEPLRSRSTKSAWSQCSAALKKVVRGNKQEKKAKIPSDFVAMDAMKRQAVSAELERFLRERLSTLKHQEGKKKARPASTKQQHARCASLQGAAVRKNNDKAGKVPSDFVAMDRQRRKTAEQVLERFLAQRLPKTQPRAKASAAAARSAQLSEATFRAKVSGQPWMCGDGAMVYLGPDGSAHAFSGASRWRVSDLRQREVAVERSDSTDPFRLYFNPAVSGFYCPERSLQAFALAQGWISPAHAAAPSAAPSQTAQTRAFAPPPPPTPSQLGPYALDSSVGHALQHSWQPAAVAGRSSWRPVLVQGQLPVQPPPPQTPRSALLAAIRAGAVLKASQPTLTLSQPTLTLSVPCPPPPPMPRAMLAGAGAAGASSLATSGGYVLRFRWSESASPAEHSGKWNAHSPKKRWVQRARAQARKPASNKTVVERSAGDQLLAARAEGWKQRAGAEAKLPSDFVAMDKEMRRTVEKALDRFLAQRLAKQRTNTNAPNVRAQTVATARTSSRRKVPRDFVAMEPTRRRSVEQALERFLAQRLARRTRQHATNAAKTCDAPKTIGSRAALRLPPALLAEIRQGVPLRVTGRLDARPRLPLHLQDQIKHPPGAAGVCSSSAAASAASAASAAPTQADSQDWRIPVGSRWLALLAAIRGGVQLRRVSLEPAEAASASVALMPRLRLLAAIRNSPQGPPLRATGRLDARPRLPLDLQDQIRDQRRSEALLGTDRLRHAAEAGALALHPRLPRQLQQEIQDGGSLRGWIVTPDSFPEAGDAASGLESESESEASDATEPEEFEDGVLVWD